MLRLTFLLLVVTTAPSCMQPLVNYGPGRSGPPEPSAQPTATRPAPSGVHRAPCEGCASCRNAQASGDSGTSISSAQRPEFSTDAAGSARRQ